MKHTYAVYEDLYDSSRSNYKSNFEYDGPQENILLNLLRGTGRVFLWILKACFWIFFLIVAVLVELCRKQSRRRRF